MGKIDDALQKAGGNLEKGKADLPPVPSGFVTDYGYPIADFANPNSPPAESYRTLRTNIQRTCQSRYLHTLLVAGASRGEGRTQTIANLAVIFSALEGNKTLLVDADLRNPRLHEIFGVEEGPGLADLLHGAATLDAVIRPTRIGNLKVIPSGRTVKGSAELFHSPRFGEMIETLKLQHDILLFDSPPVIPYTDAVILANHVEGIILVVKARETRREVVHRAKMLLNQSQDKFVGVVLNSMEYVIPRPIYEKL
ncbi:MAG: CpsD/CapB family tyrosine-protein kinase [Candidatus Omnitrophota bacterium]